VEKKKKRGKEAVWLIVQQFNGSMGNVGEWRSGNKVESFPLGEESRGD